MHGLNLRAVLPSLVIDIAACVHYAKIGIWSQVGGISETAQRGRSAVTGLKRLDQWLIESSKEGFQQAEPATRTFRKLLLHNQERAFVGCMLQHLVIEKGSDFSLTTLCQELWHCIIAEVQHLRSAKHTIRLLEVLQVLKEVLKKLDS